MLWKTSRNSAWNEAVVKNRLLWRRDIKLIQEKRHRNIAAELAVFQCGFVIIFARARVEDACRPLRQMEKSLEDIISSLSQVPAYRNSYNPDWRRVR